jgi:hypothetical protein
MQGALPSAMSSLPPLRSRVLGMLKGYWGLSFPGARSATSMWTSASKCSMVQFIAFATREMMILSSTPSYLARMPEKIKCIAQVEKQLPSCEHRAKMPCHQDPATYVCQELCGIPFSCCSKSCPAKCGACQKLNSAAGAVQPQLGPISRTQHPKHFCGRMLFCGHTCKDECKEGHTCSGTCRDKCRQICPHGGCRLACSAPCKPCMRPCAWKCSHIQCSSACGMVRSYSLTHGPSFP